MTLLEKLEAAINETERIALAASGPKACWTEWETSEFFGYETPHVLIGVGSRRQPLAGGHFTYTPVEKRFADHIARNDPARVLRRVARDRKLLRRHRPVEMAFGNVRCFHCREDHTEFGEYDNVAQPVWWPCDDVRDLAHDHDIEVKP